MSRPARRTKRQTDALILTAARELFLTEGFLRIRREHVAAQASVSPSTVRTYYPTMPDLWRAATGCPTPDYRAAERAALAGIEPSA